MTGAPARARTVAITGADGGLGTRLASLLAHRAVRELGWRAAVPSPLYPLPT